MLVIELTALSLLKSLQVISKFPRRRGEFCPLTVIPLPYEAPSFPCTVMVGETCAMPRTLLILMLRSEGLLN